MQVASDVFCPSPLKGTWIVYSSFMVAVRRARVKVRTAKEQPMEGHLAAFRETKNATKAPFHCHSQEIFYRFPSAAKGSEGFQRASGKPFGRLRRGETPRNRGKQGSLPSPPSTRNQLTCGPPIRFKRRVPKVSKGRAESPLVASAEAKPREAEESKEASFPAIHKKPVNL